MPYKKNRVPAAIFMAYGGWTIYHVYVDNDIDAGELVWGFSVAPDGSCQSEHGKDGCFYVDSLESRPAPPPPVGASNRQYIVDTIRAAIDSGELGRLFPGWAPRAPRPAEAAPSCELLQSSAIRRYLGSLFRLADLIARGEGETIEAERVRDNMEWLDADLRDDEREFARVVSAEFYELAEPGARRIRAERAELRSRVVCEFPSLSPEERERVCAAAQSAQVSAYATRDAFLVVVQSTVPTYNPQLDRGARVAWLAGLIGDFVAARNYRDLGVVLGTAPSHHMRVAAWSDELLDARFRVAVSRGFAPVCAADTGG